MTGLKPPESGAWLSTSESQPGIEVPRFDRGALERAIDDHAAQLDRTRLASSTTASYRRHAQRFVKWLYGEYRPAGSVATDRAFTFQGWTAEDLIRQQARYRAHLAKSTLAPTTIYAYQLGVSSFVAFLATSGRSAAQPLGGAGECRMQTPYRPLSPVLDPSGLRYCCDHRPTFHCSAAVAPLEPAPDA